jgi:hypothetical protein
MTSSAWKMQYSKTLSCLPWTCFLKNMHPKFWHFFQACNTVKKYLDSPVTLTSLVYANSVLLEVANF